MRHRLTSAEGHCAVWLEPEVEFAIVGESHYVEHLAQLVNAGLRNQLAAWLVVEPGNPFDANAVMVWLRGGKAGYVPRECAAPWQREILALNTHYGAPVACLAEVRGTDNPGVWLHVPGDAPAFPTDTRRGDQASASLTIDVSDLLGNMAAEDPGFAAQLAEYARREEERLSQMTAAERAAYEERLRAQSEEVSRQDREHVEQQKADEELHRRIKADRRAAIVGTQTEVGRPFGLSAVAVGRILDERQLRDRVDVKVPGCHEPLHLERGVAEGFAVFDPVDGRSFWIAERVAPLLEPRAKRKR